jgi:hypothetical protein
MIIVDRRGRRREHSFDELFWRESEGFSGDSINFCSEFDFVTM